MLLWLAGAVVVELFILLVKQVYVNQLLSWWGQRGLMYFFTAFTYLGAALTAAGIVWIVISYRQGRKMVLPCACTAAVAGVWVMSVLAYLLFDVGLNIMMVFPAAAAVLIVIYFLYQRIFFYNAMLTGGGLVALWLYRQYYAEHPTMIRAFFAAGFAALAVAVVLSFLLRSRDGRLGGLRVVPAGTGYLFTWISCAVTAAAMAATLALGLTAGYYLLFALAAWLFVQAVFFTVKLM